MYVPIKMLMENFVSFYILKDDEVLYVHMPADLSPCATLALIFQHGYKGHH